MTIFLILLLVLAVFLLFSEVIHHTKGSSPLRLKYSKIDINKINNGLTIECRIEIINPQKYIEVMIPEISLNTTLFGKIDLNHVEITNKIKANHPDEKTRTDSYWSAYIVKGGRSTYANLNISLLDAESERFHESLEHIWVEINWVNYGPFGRLKRRDGFVIPIKKVKPEDSSKANFYAKGNYKMLPIKTHLLGTLDDPIQILNYYSSKIIKEGDILTIGETPLAVMQNRYNHPENIKVSYLTKLLCKVFHPTSSLASGCGLQTLIDIVGPSRVILSIIMGIGLKLVGIKGGFYRLAGKQARLIDDITGTIPPYDQTIVLGPENPEKFCSDAAAKLGIDIAVVDVNDLGRVKILAASKGCDKTLLIEALQSNPAGNANQQTPLVLVRPC